MAGNIVISGRWGGGRWEAFAVARGERVRFSFRIPLTHRGVLRLRIAYPDGARAVGTYKALSASLNEGRFPTQVLPTSAYVCWLLVAFMSARGCAA
jgi:hypothetical protein